MELSQLRMSITKKAFDLCSLLNIINVHRQSPFGN